MAERTASVERNTLETQIKVSINLDGTGKAKFDIGVPFLEHMLDQIARHGLIDLDIQCKGDLHIDDHHTVEDVGITLGQAFTQPLFANPQYLLDDESFNLINEYHYIVDYHIPLGRTLDETDAHKLEYFTIIKNEMGVALKHRQEKNDKKR